MPTLKVQRYTTFAVPQNQQGGEHTEKTVDGHMNISAVVTAAAAGIMQTASSAAGDVLPSVAARQTLGNLSLASSTPRSTRATAIRCSEAEGSTDNPNTSTSGSYQC
jgi:hypothetical protein